MAVFLQNYQLITETFITEKKAGESNTGEKMELQNKNGKIVKV